MTAIKRRDLPHGQALGRRNDGGVDRPEGEIPVGRNELGDTQPVRRDDALRYEVPRREVTDEAHLSIGSDTRAEQVRHLGDDQFRYDQWARVRLEQLEALLVVGVVGVDVGIERPSVDDQRDPGPSVARISSIRSETSDRPLRPAAAARSRRRVRLAPRCASIASRVSSETVVP